MDPTSQQALVIIAVALTIQTLLLIVLALAIAYGWRRATGTVEARLRALDARLDDFTSRFDDLARHVGSAARTVEGWSAQASAFMDDAGSVARSVASAVAAPKALLLAGAASAVSRTMARWRRSRHASEAVHG